MIIAALKLKVVGFCYIFLAVWTRMACMACKLTGQLHGEQSPNVAV
jgi:hypothetical protein